MDYESNDEKMRKEFDRSLPPQEYESDRWARAARLGYGDGTSVYASAYIYGSPIVGKDVWIGPNTLIDASHGMVKIGDGCHISTGVQIYTHSSLYRCLELGDDISGDVTVGDHVYIGANSIIYAGVTIGDHSAILPGSIVSKDVERESVVMNVNERRPMGVLLK